MKVTLTKEVEVTLEDVHQYLRNHEYLMIAPDGRVAIVRPDGIPKTSYMGYASGENFGDKSLQQIIKDRII